MNTVTRLMAELGLAGRKIRRRRGPGKRPAFPDFVRRDFTADAPDQVWAGDMTEIVTGEGKLYLATVIDLFSRRLLGHAMGERHDAELVVASLHMAAATRGGDVRGRDLPLGPRQRISVPALRTGLPPARRDPVHGPCRLVFRQRRQRGVQQRAQGRVRPPAHLHHPHRGPAEDRHLDHRLLQHPSTTSETIRPTPPWSWPLKRSPRREGIDRAGRSAFTDVASRYRTPVI